MWDPTPQQHHDRMTFTGTLSIRTATAADDGVLRHLSALDSARTVQRPALLAVIDGTAVAAASLRDGRVVADPFSPTEDVVRMLRARGTSRPARRRARRPFGRLPRLRPAI
jgi:hypothetical protein